MYKKLHRDCGEDVLHLWATAEEAKTAQWVYFVHVCSFMFAFHSVEQISEYLNYFSHAIKPSSRTREGATWRVGVSRGDHWERQSRFDRLPLYLFEEPKRVKVVAALERARKLFGRDRISQRLSTVRPNA
ncbi:MAG: hypothetical protein JWQ02_939 [Capsulimonas sp.]|nr:hypothetical protein [Capsulimonas sp.]